MGKRLLRAKKTLAGSRTLFGLGGATDVAARLPAVLRALYLLFNEGYHGASAERAVRVGLCEEALRLGGLLLENPLTATPAAHALMALFHFNAALLRTRVDASGDLVPLVDQDRSLWDPSHLAEGRSGCWSCPLPATSLTTYHLEAAIADLHADARLTAETDWDGIAALYETLLRIQPSPVVALNRAVAIAQRDGPARGLEEIQGIPDRRRLLKYPFYFTAIAEFELPVWGARRPPGSRSRRRSGWPAIPPSGDS